MQCKDIADAPILKFLGELADKAVPWGTINDGYPNSVSQSMPAGVAPKLVRAKMASLLKRELVSGCVCGCRGDFELMAKGRSALEASA